MSKKNHGFTLIEMAVALTVLALAVAGGLSVFTRSKEVQNVRITRERQEMILKMLDRYYLKFTYIPCPADPTALPTAAGFGRWAGTGTGNCSTAPLSGSGVFMGAVPIGALGLDAEYTLDGWGRQMMYVVDQNMTAAASFASSTPVLTVQDAANNSAIYDSTGAAAANAAVILISYGKNGFGAYRYKGTSTRVADTVSGGTAARRSMEDDNAQMYSATVNASFRMLDLREAEGATPDVTIANQVFDDILAWRTKDQLTNASRH